VALGIARLQIRPLLDRRYHPVFRERLRKGIVSDEASRKVVDDKVWWATLCQECSSDRRPRTYTSHDRKGDRIIPSASHAGFYQRLDIVKHMIYSYVQTVRALPSLDEGGRC